MPVIDLHDKKDFDSGTKTKLDIFENYLTEWLPTFLFHNSELTICDFFAGPGEDIFHNPGSPLRIFVTVHGQ
jgi:three-Cys-motif partner protein